MGIGRFGMKQVSSPWVLEKGRGESLPEVMEQAKRPVPYIASVGEKLNFFEIWKGGKGAGRSDLRLMGGYWHDRRH